MCTHSRETSNFVTQINDWSGDDESHWEYGSESTYVDTGLHTYKCTMCGEVFYYSEKARLAHNGQNKT